MIDVQTIWNSAYVQYGISKEAINMRTQANNEFIQQMTLGMVSLSSITPQTLKVYTNKYKEKKVEEIKSKISSQKTQQTEKNNNSQSTQQTEQTQKTTSEKNETEKTNSSSNSTENTIANKNSYIVRQNVILQTAEYATKAFANQSILGNNINLIT